MDKRVNIAGQGEKPFLPIKCVVFTWDKTLKILLKKKDRQGCNTFPEGMVRLDENLDDGLRRMIFSVTGVKTMFFRQVEVRDRASATDAEEKKIGSLSLQRVLTINFYAIIRKEELRNVPDEELYSWHDIHSIPKLDNEDVECYRKSFGKIQRNLNYDPICYYFLPQVFTMAELQGVYEQILAMPMNRGNFYRKIKGYDILNKLSMTRSVALSRPSELYQFNLQKYFQGLENGLAKTW